MKKSVSQVVICAAVLAGLMLVPFLYVGIIYPDSDADSILHNRNWYDRAAWLCYSKGYDWLHRPAFWIGEKVFYPWRNASYYFPVIVGLKYGLAWLINAMALAVIGLFLMGIFGAWRGGGKLEESAEDGVDHDGGELKQG